MKLIFLLFLTANVVRGDTCEDRLQPYWNICNQQQGIPLRIDPAAPVKRGKMGPRGEKGEKGIPGKRGADLSAEVEGLNRNLIGKIELLENEKSFYFLLFNIYLVVFYYIILFYYFLYYIFFSANILSFQYLFP